MPSLQMGLGKGCHRLEIEQNVAPIERPALTQGPEQRRREKQQSENGSRPPEKDGSQGTPRRRTYSRCI